MATKLNLKPDSHIYFMGIGGTGMASVAGLCQQAGFKVSGSDAGIYPPTSLMLEKLKIKVSTPYDPQNVDLANPDCIVVANVLSRGHLELEHAIEKAIPYTSFPELMGQVFLEKARSVVVAGTHGKTTTTSIAAFLLDRLGANPGYLIGGAPKGLPQSFAVGSSLQGGVFVIEGDEYDTAFFDKNSKFLHYFPKYLILNNLEFDHADIFKDLAAIEAQFSKLIAMVPDQRNIIANVNDPGIDSLLKKLGLEKTVTRVGSHESCDVQVIESGFNGQQWFGQVETPEFGKFEFNTQLTGEHNIANLIQVIALLDRLTSDKAIESISSKTLANTIAAFEGVARRLDKLFDSDSISVYEDFAHHPTSVMKVLSSFRASFPDRRLVVAFEPRNATSRRNIFTDQFAASLSVADHVLIGECAQDKRIQEDERMNTKTLQTVIGSKAKAFDSNEDLLMHAQSHLEDGDTIIFMSCGSFSGIQHKLAAHLKSKV